MYEVGYMVTLFGTACMRDGVHVRGGVHGYLIWHCMCMVIMGGECKMWLGDHSDS